jgi:hypothetical protein
LCYDTENKEKNMENMKMVAENNVFEIRVLQSEDFYGEYYLLFDEIYDTYEEAESELKAFFADLADLAEMDEENTSHVDKKNIVIAEVNVKYYKPEIQ